MIPSDYKPGQLVSYGDSIGLTGYQPPSEQPSCYVLWIQGEHQNGFYPLQWLELIANPEPEATEAERERGKMEWDAKAANEMIGDGL